MKHRTWTLASRDHVNERNDHEVVLMNVLNASTFCKNYSDSSLTNIDNYCQILARQEEIPQKTSKNISRYFCSSFQGHV